MPKMRFIDPDGPGRNLGRFGWVNSGEVLDLTDAEVKSVAGDPRFVDEAAPVVVKSSPLPSIHPHEQETAATKQSEPPRSRGRR